MTFATSDTAAPAELRDFSQSLPMALLRARENVMRSFRPLLAEHGVTEQQWRTLRALAGADAPIEMGDLAERTVLHGPSLSRIVIKLEERALIERSTVETDQRRIAVVITDHGRRLVEEIAPRSEARYADLEHALGSEDLAQLYALLGRLGALDMS